jgi:L-threonylcarbamoyladenylate synthase
MRIVPAASEYIPLGIEFFKKGFVGVLPTDTLYGICADALNPEAVEKIYTLKWRNKKKPLIVLIENLEQLGKLFGIKELPPSAEKLLLYTKPVSVLLDVENFEWISRGSKKIAFRLVKEGFIKDFLKEFGKPIVAPSANWEGFPPARDVFQAFNYFGNGVAVYYNGGVLKGNPSALVDVNGNKVSLLRRGILSLEELSDLFDI